MPITSAVVIMHDHAHQVVSLSSDSLMHACALSQVSEGLSCNSPVVSVLGRVSTFASAVSAVPHLGDSCCSVLTMDGVPGSGLKLMRLVSTQLRATMLDMVKGFTLGLDGKAGSLPDQMKLLDSTRLSRLRVMVTDDHGDTSLGGFADWSIHTLLLSTFLSGMAGAIRNVSHLNITIPANTEHLPDEEPSVLLSLLAPACPALHSICITGNISRSLFAAFGSSCSKLSSLTVMHGVHAQSLVDVHLLLPHLTCCALAGPPLFSEDEHPKAWPYTISLLSCTLLTHLDVGLSTLTAEMWHALPSGLRTLKCSTLSKPVQIICKLPVLHSLTCNCKSSNNFVSVTLRTITSVLRVAPQLQSVILSCGGGELDGDCAIWISRRCAPSTVSNVMYLHERILAGLTVTSTTFVGSVQQGVHIWLWDSPVVDQELHEPQDGRIREFVAQLCPLPQITGLLLSSCYPDNSHALLSGQFASKFPAVEILLLECPDSNAPTDLTHLGHCQALRSLTLEGAVVCPVSLAILCTRLLTLKKLHLVECQGISAAEGASLQQQLQAWGIDLAVSVLSSNI